MCDAITHKYMVKEEHISDGKGGDREWDSCLIKKCLRWKDPRILGLEIYKILYVLSGISETEIKKGKRMNSFVSASLTIERPN